MNKNWIKTWAILAPHGFKRRQIKVRSKTFSFFISQLHTRLFQTMKFKSLPYSQDGEVLIGILPSGKDIELPFNRDSIIPLSPYQI